MTSNLLPAPCQGTRRSDLLERRLRRYHPRFQEAVRALAMRHPRTADLAASFPALLFALAVPQARLDPACAIACVIDGAALAQVAALAGLPLWLRKLPPEAFAGPIPRLPDGDLFRRQIANHLPRSPKLASTWLQLVADAAELAHEPMAAWIAREFVREPRQVTPARLRLIGLWAWFSCQPETFGHDLIERPWKPDMRIGAARSAASDWRMIVALHANLGRLQISDMWLRTGRIAGYEFVPLNSIAAIADEAKAMSTASGPMARTSHTTGRGSGASGGRANGSRRCGSPAVIVIHCRTSSSSRGRAMWTHRARYGGRRANGCTGTICRRST
jgi:hypothetical protein